MSGHRGRCFRAFRRTVARKLTQGIVWTRPIRQKVPQVLRPFMALLGGNQLRASMQQIQMGIIRYAQHQAMIGEQGSTA